MSKSLPEQLGVGSDVEQSYKDARSRMVGWAEGWLQEMPDQLDLDDAGDMIQAFELRANLHEDGKWFSRFLLGELTRRVRAQTEHGKITELMQNIADQFAININTLRYAVGCARAFDGNIKKFDRWLQSGGYPKRWKHIKAITRLKTDVTELGAGELADEVIRIVEGVADEIEKVNDDLDEEKREALEGASMRFGEEAARFRGKSLRQLESAEGETGDDEKSLALQSFEAMVRRMECAGCHKWPEGEGVEAVYLDPHHVSPSATSKKKNHWLRIPLCRACHNKLHNGIAKFEKETGTSVTKAVADTLHYYVAGDTPSWPPIFTNGTPQ